MGKRESDLSTQAGREAEAERFAGGKMPDTAERIDDPLVNPDPPSDDPPAQATDLPQDAELSGLVKGRIVHYMPSIADGLKMEEPIAGIIVRVWNKAGLANLRLQLDSMDNHTRVEKDTLLVTSRNYSEDPKPGTWRFIPRS